MYPAAEDFVWDGIEPDEIEPMSYAVIGRVNQFSKITFHPKPEHHNANLTCTVVYQKSVRTERTVVLEVRRMYHFITHHIYEITT